jgi:hypothetical protein
VACAAGNPLLAQESSNSSQDISVDFARDIRPLLSDRCFACHGPDEAHRQADLRVDQIESLTANRGDYQVVVPGDASSSELLRRITSHDSSEVMPPPESGKPLTGEQQELLRRWIDAGAVWQKHWAYETPVPSLSPPTSHSFASLSQNWIDAYVARQLQEQGGQFSPPAAPVTLLRRLAFDLTGLPPGMDSVLQQPQLEFTYDYQRTVDSLLASPAFGERMAMLWLDLVRYADTVGYHGDQDHNISLYRDYVIHAFNDNKPFDQFTIEQLAGDLLPEPTEEQLIATGYNRLLQTSHEGGIQPKEYLAIYAADRVRNLSAVWMGATVGCAQCHDHKFDPYTAHDFYTLAAFFADVDEAQHFSLGSNELPTRRPPEKAFLDRATRALMTRTSHSRTQLQLALQNATSESQRAELQANLAHLDSQIAQIEKSTRVTMITQAIEPRTMRFLPRGNWLDDSGEIMQPAVPRFLGELASSRAGAESSHPGRPTRLDLARWLVDAEQGVGLLTARVFVNRLWMIMFGFGLSRSVEDFGGQGEPPSHPELLDRLAIEFVRSGWDVKHLLRTIAASRTYQQDSLETNWSRQHDPGNRFLTRQNRFRLPAESVRDCALACSHLLVSRTGGASVRPYQPEGYYRHLNFPTREYQPSLDENQWRRGVYVHWQRQFLHPMLRAFDAPTREECTAQRVPSNTPLSALAWLNDPSFVEAARGLAVRAGLEASGATERLVVMFRYTTSREPDATEVDQLQELFTFSLEYFTQHPELAREMLAVGLFEGTSGEAETTLAAWTNVARAVLNLNETYTRN